MMTTFGVGYNPLNSVLPPSLGSNAIQPSLGRQQFVASTFQAAAGQQSPVNTILGLAQGVTSVQASERDGASVLTSTNGVRGVVLDRGPSLDSLESSRGANLDISV